MIFLEEDAAAEIMVGPFVSETDGVTPQTGINWSNANIEFTKMVGGVPTSSAITDHGVAGVNEIAELQDGYYRIKLTATNLNTAGPAYITFRDDDIFLAVMHSFTIMAAAAYQWLILGTGSIPGIAATLQTALGTDGSDQIAELAQAKPPANPTVAEALMLGYMAIRNRLDSTASETRLYNDAGGVFAKSADTDDGTLMTTGELIAGP
jgi:hypothetical protein